MTTDRPDRGDALKRALVELRALRARVQAAEALRAAPIAIVGIGCRFPGGADSPAALWRLLQDGVDATREVPAARWDADAFYDPAPDRPGKMYTRRGGFLDEVDGFDERFFHITAREARVMDPQQRLWLEVAWEALEDAALAPDRLARTRTGVFVGITGSDYAQLITAETRVEDLDGYVGLGTAASFTPGRLAYLLGLQGPAFALDSACSSSLVAVHLACQSLRAGDSDLALAGGVNLMLSPASHIALCRAHVLARDGRCKTFDAAADGYARAEGCGVVVLRRLADAQANDDRILAVIRGSAVNQDGPSSGLTVPSGAAQQAVIGDALAAAGLAPADVGYVEAHGTGTQLGDPIELRAIAAALGAGRSPAHPVLVGSIKTNLGHLEAASGIAGLIKAALVVHHGVIPVHGNVTVPTPQVDWSRLPLALPRATQAWPADRGDRRIAGVSSFGASGTNAHVVVEAAPPAQASEPAQRPIVLVLSARTEPALAAVARRYARQLAHGDDPLVDVCRTAALGRAHLEHRAAVTGADRATLVARLTALADGEAPAGVARHRAGPSDGPRIAFLFTGQGSQHAGMAAQLHETEPVFRAALDRCAVILRPHLARPLLDTLRAGDADTGGAAIDRTEVAQPAIVAVGWALGELWRSWGVEPAAVIGHSVGEYLAACVAGVIGLEDLLPLVALRGRLMQALPGGGAMAAIFAGEDAVAAALRELAGELAIAAVNGPSETVVSGRRADVDRVVARFAAAGVASRALAVSHAFHSPLIDPVLEPLERAVAALALAPPAIPLAANLTGALARDELTTARYFRDAARAPVRFADALRTLHREGIALFLEIGAAPVLSAMGRRVMPEATFVPSLRPGKPDREALAEAAGTLHTRGARLDWRSMFGPGRRAPLPTYPFERKRHWFAASPRPDPITRMATTLCSPRSQRAGDGDASEVELDAAAHPVLRDHRVYGQIVVSGVVHMVLIDAALGTCDRGIEFADAEFPQPLLLPEAGPRRVSPVLAAASDGWTTFELVSQLGATRAVHARGRVRALGEEGVPTGRMDLAALRARLADDGDGARFYEPLWRPGEHELGPAFRTIERVWRRDGEALVQIAVPDVLAHAAAQLRAAGIAEVYGQALMPAVPDYRALAADPDHTFIGHAIARSRDTRATDRAAYCHALLRHQDRDQLIGDLALLDRDGHVLATVNGLRVRRISRAAMRTAIAGAARRGAASPVDVSAWRAQGPDRLRAEIIGYLARHVAAIVGASEPPSARDRLAVLGLDSLMAVELRDRIAAELAIDLPLTELAGDPSIEDLGRTVMARLEATPPAIERPPAPAAASAWLVPLSHGAGTRLFALPHGGGGASAFHPWRAQLPAHVEAYAVQLPGRESRLNEPALAELDAIVDRAVAALAPYLDRPFVLFGASMGGLCAFEIARALRRRGLPAPAKLVIAAYPAPHLRSAIHAHGDAMRAAFAAGADAAGRLLRDLGMLPAALLDHPDALAVALATLRADLEAVLGHRHRDEPPLAVDLLVLGGRRDPDVPRPMLEAWARHVSGTFQLEELDGPHLFYRTHASEVMRLLDGVLASISR